MSNEPTTGEQPQHVPEHWPISATPPVSPAIGWLLTLPAYVGVLIVPGCLGHRLAQSSWLKATTAVLLSLILTAWVVAADPWLRIWSEVAAGIAVSDLTPWQMIRLPLARMTMEAYFHPMRTEEFVLTLVAIAGGLVGLCLMSTFVMPFIAAGERAWLRHGRTVKLLMWSSV
ncbi:MAG: hypothetical protein JXO22_06740, partial [Phycisphaerae bacterium]|nr:hypothetical protein [Phycisphaerae bacterium]